LSSQDQMLAQLKQQGLIDPDIFISQQSRLSEQIRAAKQEKARLLDRSEDTALRDTQDLLDILESGPDFLDAFDRDLFGELVERVIVESSERVRFRLKNGLELAESIERTVR
ncbi:MAG: recombinase family protein, partial [Angelakisella sp.]|nr:recombinase family protein [Angelakisella sp.]